MTEKYQARLCKKPYQKPVNGFLDNKSVHNGMPIEKNGHTKMFFAITFETSKLQECTIPLQKDFFITKNFFASLKGL